MEAETYGIYHRKATNEIRADKETHKHVNTRQRKTSTLRDEEKRGGRK